MQHTHANNRPLARTMAALCALVLAVGLSPLPLSSVKAHADEIGSAAASSRLLWPFDATVDVGFFIAVVDQNATSYPENEEELQQILTGQYSPGIYIDDAFDASDFINYGGHLYGQELYDLTGKEIDERILVFPTVNQIAAACAQGGIEFDPETQTVVWYVVKSALSTWDTVWHIDGLLVPKAIAPDPDEPVDPDPEPEPGTDPDDPDEPSEPVDPDPDEPVEPEPEPDPDVPVDPDEPVDPEPEPDPDDPDTPDTPADPDPDEPVDPDEPAPDDPDGDDPSDPEGPGQEDPVVPEPDNPNEPAPSDPEDPDDVIGPGDGSLDDGQNGTSSDPDQTTSVQPPASSNTAGGNVAQSISQAIVPLRTASPAPDTEGAAGSATPSSTNDVMAPEAEASDPQAAAEAIADAETPLTALSDISDNVLEGGVSAPQGGLSESASTALHVAGAVGLAGVAAGAVAVNVALAQAGNALSSLDSSLRNRGRGRRR